MSLQGILSYARNEVNEGQFPFSATKKYVYKEI
jgi:hypothetical protein